MVATEGGRYLGSLAAWASRSAASRRATRARWRCVSAACKGPRNSRKPAGRSRAALKPGGVEFTGARRPERDGAVVERSALVIVVAIFLSGPVSGGKGPRVRAGW